MSNLWKILILLLFICLTNVVSAQTREYNISGFVKDAVTGEVLTGANILLYKDSLSTGSQHYRGTASNNSGFYVFPKLPPNNYYLIVRYLGYKTAIKELFNLKENNIHFNITLSPEEIKKEEVIVTGEKTHKTLISNIDVSPELLSGLPSLSGETDLLKLLQLLQIGRAHV